MLATADLAGYIDTWILNAESQQDLTIENGGAGQTSSDSESSDSEEESVAEGSNIWTRNPNGKLLPKLPAAPAVLSFAAQVPGEDGATDYILLGVTGQWTVNLFHPLQGSLTPWSRRHPKKTLPAPFQDLLDLAKGCFWQGPRVWIYGVSFLGMLDTSVDLPKPSDLPESEAEAAGMKRKRTGYATGAGSKMAQSNLVPHHVSRHVNGGADEDIDMDDVTRSDDEHEGVHSDDETADAVGHLVQARNGRVGSSGELLQSNSQKKSWWMTYKYRPVFGVVALSETEVVLVERPLWDVDMPDRFIAGEPWER
jgi:U3 small nucleolar RNA-associated protein 4